MKASETQSPATPNLKVKQSKPWSSPSFNTEGTKAIYGYMRQKELMQVVPFSPATLWRLVKTGQFVQPVKISARITAWNRVEVHAWLESKGGA
jgi:predicted DNA-binding transcriptional regulator AlpA